jgi:hypothetical protein
MIHTIRIQEYFLTFPQEKLLLARIVVQNLKKNE